MSIKKIKNINDQLDLQYQAQSASATISNGNDTINGTANADRIDGLNGNQIFK